MNVWDILIIILITAAVILAVAKLIRDKRRGKGCCNDCSCCSGCRAHSTHTIE